MSTEGFGVGVGGAVATGANDGALPLQARMANPSVATERPWSRGLERCIAASMKRPGATVKGTFGPPDHAQRQEPGACVVVDEGSCASLGRPTARSDSAQEQAQRDDCPDRDDRGPQGERRQAA